MVFWSNLQYTVFMYSECAYVLHAFSNYLSVVTVYYGNYVSFVNYL